MQSEFCWARFAARWRDRAGAADEKRSVFRQEIHRLPGGQHGDLQDFGQFQERLDRPSQADAVAHQDHRPLGGVEQANRFDRFRQVGGAAGVGKLAWIERRQFRLVQFGGLHVQGNIEPNRPRPAVLG